MPVTSSGSQTPAAKGRSIPLATTPVRKPSAHSRARKTPLLSPDKQLSPIAGFVSAPRTPLVLTDAVILPPAAPPGAFTETRIAEATHSFTDAMTTATGNFANAVHASAIAPATPVAELMPAVPLSSTQESAQDLLQATRATQEPVTQATQEPVTQATQATQEQNTSSKMPLPFNGTPTAYTVGGMALIIEDSVPLPVVVKAKRNEGKRRGRYPIHEIQVGGSIFVPGYSVNTRTAHQFGTKILALFSFRKQRPGSVWTHRDGVEVMFAGTAQEKQVRGTRVWLKSLTAVAPKT